MSVTGLCQRNGCTYSWSFLEDSQRHLWICHLEKIVISAIGSEFHVRQNVLQLKEKGKPGILDKLQVLERFTLLMRKVIGKFPVGGWWGKSSVSYRHMCKASGLSHRPSGALCGVREASSELGHLSAAVRRPAVWQSRSGGTNYKAISSQSKGTLCLACIKWKVQTDLLRWSQLKDC